MKSVFQILLGDPEQSDFQEEGFNCDEVEEAIKGFQRLISQADLQGKKVEAKLIFDGQLICFHRFDTIPPSSICFSEERKQMGDEQEQAMMFFHRGAGQLTKKQRAHRGKFTEAILLSPMWWYVRNAIRQSDKAKMATFS